MSKHMVVCRECGKTFDASKGGYYDKVSRRYTCKSCGAKLKKEQRAVEADRREASTGMRQSTGAMIAKIAVGVIFIISAFMTGTVAATLLGIVIGLALIAWALLPWYKVKKDAADKAKREAAEAAAAEEKRLNAPKMCPACGAHTKGEICEYCGAKLPD